MTIKQTIQYRIPGAVVGGQWRDLPPGNELAVAASIVYEFRILDVYPVGYKFKSKWGATIYEVIGDPVTTKFGGEETTNYPIRATESDGDVWYEFETELVISKAEAVKQ